MSWIEKVRQKTKKEKTRLIAKIAGIILLLLVLFWVLIGNYNPFNGAGKSFWNGVKNSINKAKQ